VSKFTGELRALKPGPGSENRGPAGATGAKCCGSSAGEANAGTVLVEEAYVNGSCLFVHHLHANGYHVAAP
jgi:hypothetical protein